MLIGNKLISQVLLLLPVTVTASNRWYTYLCLNLHILSLSFFLVFSPSQWGGCTSGCWFVWLKSTHHISQIFVAWEKHFLSSLTGGVTGGDCGSYEEAAWKSFQVSKSSFCRSVGKLSAWNDILTWMSREQIISYDHITCGALMLQLPQTLSLKNGKWKWSTFMFTNTHKWIILLL